MNEISNGVNFWQELPKPFLCVAPMADVTDAAFRCILAKYSKTLESQPFVMWTEFVAADGLRFATPEGKDKLLKDFLYDETERPIVAQIFSGRPENIELAAAQCRALGFDGIDINMGCPVQKIAKQGAGSAMILEPENARAVIRAAKAGAGDIPVSVKTRLGYHEEEIETWIPAVLAEQPAALTVHCRTRKDMSKVPARWDRLVRIRELRDQLAPETILIGNGDVLTQSDAYSRIAEAGVDGAMVGRALFGNPWFFHPSKRLPHELKALPTSGVDREELIERTGTDRTVEYVSLEERLTVLVEHTRLFVELLPHKSFNVMKKHYKGYVNGFSGAATLRSALMQAHNPDEVATITAQFLASQSQESATL